MKKNIIFIFILSFLCSCSAKENYKVHLISDTFWKVFPNNNLANSRTDVLSSIQIDLSTGFVSVKQGEDSVVYIVDSCRLTVDSLLTIYSHIDDDLSAIITADCKNYNNRLIIQQRSENFLGKCYNLQYRIIQKDGIEVPLTDIDKNQHFPFLNIPMDCTASEMSERLINIGFNYGYHNALWTHLTGYVYDLLCDVCICETPKSHMVDEIRISLHKPYSQNDVMILLNNLIINYGNFESPYNWFFLTYKDPRGAIKIYELNNDLDIRFVDKINEGLD